MNRTSAHAQLAPHCRSWTHWLLLAVLLLLLAACGGQQNSGSSSIAPTAAAVAPTNAPAPTAAQAAASAPAPSAASAATAAPVATAATEPTAAATGKTVKVVTTMSILADMVKHVGGDRVEAENIIPIGAGPEDYQPTPLDAQKIAGADIVFYNGHGLEEWLDDLFKSAAYGAKYVEKIRDGLIQADPAGK